MDEDEDYDYTVEAVPASPLHAIDVAILVLDTLRRVALIPVGFFGELNDLLCRHANYKVAQRAMVREASAEIERMVSGE